MRFGPLCFSDRVGKKKKKAQLQELRLFTLVSSLPKKAPTARHRLRESLYRDLFVLIGSAIKTSLTLFWCCGHHSVWAILLAWPPPLQHQAPMFRVNGLLQGEPCANLHLSLEPITQRWASFRMSSDETLRITQVCMLPLHQSTGDRSGNVEPSLTLTSPR